MASQPQLSGLRRLIRKLGEALSAAAALDDAVDVGREQSPHQLARRRGHTAVEPEEGIGAALRRMRVLRDLDQLMTDLTNTRDALLGLHYEIVVDTPQASRGWGQVNQLTASLRRENTTVLAALEQSLLDSDDHHQAPPDRVRHRLRTLGYRLRRVSVEIDRIDHDLADDPQAPAYEPGDESPDESDPTTMYSAKATAWEIWITRRNRGGLSVSTVALRTVAVCGLEFCLLILVLHPAAFTPDCGAWTGSPSWAAIYGLACIVVVATVIGTRYFRMTTYWSEVSTFALPIPTYSLMVMILSRQGLNSSALLCLLLTIVGGACVARLRGTIHAINTLNLVSHVRRVQRERRWCLEHGLWERFDQPRPDR